MLEIILLVWLCSSLGKILRAKGHKPLVFQILLVVSWFGAEFVVGFVAGFIRAVQLGNAQPQGFDITGYVFALIGAACAGGFWFLVANLMPRVQPAYSPDYAKTDPIIGPPPDFAPPADPNNPYSPPRADN